MPKVSVVIPTYNRADLLKEAIKSVLNQTFEDFELIVVDDASTDNTKKAVKGFKDKRIRYIRHKENKGNVGGSISRNTGVKNAKGGFIAFLDDDDLWLPQKLEKQVKILEGSGSDVIATYSSFVLIDEEGEVIGGSPARHTDDLYGDLLVRNYVGTTSSVMAKAKGFKEVGLFDETLPSSQDWDMWLRLAKRYRFIPVDEPLIKYRVRQKRAQKRAISAGAESAVKGRGIVYGKIKSDLEKRGKGVKAAYFFEEGRFYAGLGLLGRARRAFSTSFKICPAFRTAFFWGVSLLPQSWYKGAVSLKRVLQGKEAVTRWG